MIVYVEFSFPHTQPTQRKPSLSLLARMREDFSGGIFTIFIPFKVRRESFLGEFLRYPSFRFHDAKWAKLRLAIVAFPLLFDVINLLSFNPSHISRSIFTQRNMEHTFCENSRWLCLQRILWIFYFLIFWTHCFTLTIFISYFSNSFIGDLLTSNVCLRTH